MAEINLLNKETEVLFVDKNPNDPFINFQLASTDTFLIGVSNPNLVLNYNATKPTTGTNLWTYASATTARTMPLQPAFYAALPNLVADTNVTGDGSVYFVGSSGNYFEAFDRGGNFNVAAGVFTAPVTGRYFLNCQLYARDLTAAHTACNIRFIVSNRNFYKNIGNIGVMRNPSNDFMPSINCFVDMDAADVAHVELQILNGALVVDISGGLPFVVFPTFFAGMLVH